MTRLVSILLLCTLLACDLVDKNPPVAMFVASPPFGDSLTVFSLDASQSQDDMSESWQIMTRWDIYNDGEWETGFTTQKQFACRFSHNGVFAVTCEVMDGGGNTNQITQTILVTPTRKDSTFTDSRTGEDFTGVYLYNRWWMNHNLNYGQTVDTSALPKDNELIEKYLHPQDQEYGGFYTWDEATFYKKDTIQGICPDGWRLPRGDDIQLLLDVSYFQQYLDEYLGVGGKFGLNFPLSGRYYRVRDVWDGAGYRGNFWINDGTKPTRFKSWAFYRSDYILNTIYEADWGVPGIEGWPIEWGEFNYNKIALPVRCVRDNQ